MKIKRYAVFTKWINEHFAPSGFVTTFEVVTEQIDFFGTRQEAESFINDQTDVQANLFWSIEEVYIKAPIPVSQNQ